VPPTQKVPPDPKSAFRPKKCPPTQKVPLDPKSAARPKNIDIPSDRLIPSDR
jgi:hypothetical protein